MASVAALWRSFVRQCFSPKQGCKQLTVIWEAECTSFLQSTSIEQLCLSARLLKLSPEYLEVDKPAKIWTLVELRCGGKAGMKQNQSPRRCAVRHSDREM